MNKSIITVGYVSQENTEFGILSSSRWKYTVNTTIQKKILKKGFICLLLLRIHLVKVETVLLKKLKEQKDAERGKGQ